MDRRRVSCLFFCITCFSPLESREASIQHSIAQYRSNGQGGYTSISAWMSGVWIGGDRPKFNDEGRGMTGEETPLGGGLPYVIKKN